MKRILAFGDSLTEGYYRNGMGLHPYTIKLEELAKQNGKNCEIVNEGISGNTVQQMLQRLPAILKSSVIFLTISSFSFILFLF